MPPRAIALALALALILACSRPPAQPDTSSNSQRLPFDRQPPASGSTDHSLVPPAGGLSEGTFFTIRLSKALSSATAHAGDSFQGALDDPIIVDEQTLLPRGAQVNGRVLDVKPSDGAHSPGYLRITLTSVSAGGKTVLIDTSSIFTKATLHNDRPSPSGAPAPSSNDVLFTPDRRLTFRLAQAVDLQ